MPALKINHSKFPHRACDLKKPSGCRELQQYAVKSIEPTRIQPASWEILFFLRFFLGVEAVYEEEGEGCAIENVCCSTARKDTRCKRANPRPQKPNTLFPSKPGVLLVDGLLEIHRIPKHRQGCLLLFPNCLVADPKEVKGHVRAYYCAAVPLDAHKESFFWPLYLGGNTGAGGESETRGVRVDVWFVRACVGIPRG